MIRFSALSLGLTLLISGAGVAAGDDITDTLDAARQAYEAGDISSALEELTFAQSMLQDLRTESLAKFLPPAPDGWTLEASNEMGGMMALTGGGTSTEGTYSMDDQSFVIRIMMDSPMIAALGGMASNPMLAKAAGGKLERIGSEKVLKLDGNLTSLIDSRILLTAEGGDTDLMMSLLELMDFEALRDFGR